MSNTLKVVKASVGSYKDKEGKTKYRYRTIGNVIQTRSGEMLVIDVMPLNWDGVAFLNEPEPQTGRIPVGAPTDMDDVPF